jgi:acyl-CoA synthetase (AMP-forming)/AMP-acid ligase II
MNRVISHILYVENTKGCIWPPTKAQLALASKDTHLIKTGPDRFRYKNDKLVNKYINYLKSRTKHLLLIGAHRNGEPEPALEMNALYSKNVDYLNIPYDNWWQQRCCYDGTHYGDSGAEFVCSYVERYVDRLDKNINDILRDAPKDKKIVINNIEKTFGEFYKDSRLAGTAIANKTNQNDIVIISKKTSFSQIEAYIGAILYERIPIIVPHPSKKVFHNEFLDKMKKIDSACSPALCVADAEYKDVYSDLWNTVTDLKCKKQLPLSGRPKKNDTAFIQLSSGTTGLPKVIKISHGALIEQCYEYSNALNIEKDDVVVSWLPLYHDMGLIACLWLPLLSGMSFVHINPFEWLSRPNMLLEMIEKHHGTHTWMPNFAFSFMSKRCKKAKYDLSSMKEWVSCSEVAHENDMLSFYNAFKDLGVTKDSLSVCYALAENVFAASHCKGLIPKDVKESNTLCCGQLIPGTSVIIMNNGEILSSSESKSNIGNIYIKSSYMAKNLSTNKYGYYDTEDVGFMSSDGLYVLGRSDDMIISYGKNIFPYSIEQIISDVDGVVPGRVACFGAHNESKGTQNVFIVAESDLKNTTQLTEKIIESVIKKIEIAPICKVVGRNYIIKTSSGKISRKRTRAKVLADDSKK